MKKFMDVKSELRELFMTRGWGIEIEGETLPYYKVYTTMLEFIDEQFYDGIANIKETKAEKKADIIKCPSCGSSWKTYRKTANEYKCRSCGNVYGEKKKEKILPPPKPKLDESYYFKCEKCGKKRALYRARTKDYRCRECGHTFITAKAEKSVKSRPKPKEGYYFVCKNCKRKKVIYRTKTDDFRCRVCKHVSKRS